MSDGSGFGLNRSKSSLLCDLAFEVAVAIDCML